ncbi:ABC-2 type transport system ATP-binding protein [Scopulibacillus darangshiensis]|uniref:ABC-2 type transport system ATP-binding protein n=1 Tax=Scopulibacillus darangshiensis TaxID=442528 RepID=A0A4R2P4Q0_9BACL|nr:ABC transporter ATP-binding protein [Scopulibacillus darangshiensis]TCP28735.1 ABC-2 type transport system ATP-binding protein [Scopulibacillus darangshiensis]
MDSIVTLKEITKTYRAQKAVDHVSFSINKGEVVAILGSNGAGKTTTVMMMLGLLAPTHGTVQLFNKDPRSKAVREKIGAMLQEVSVMDGLKVKELLQLFRSYYPNPLTVEELINLTGLEEADLKKRTEKLSGGQKRRLGFALALAGNPDLLFFDEPTVGMDITARGRFWDTIRTFAKAGKTIIFTTHYLQEADDSAERIILFNKGAVVMDGTPQEVKQKLSKKSVSFITDDEVPLKVYEQLPKVTHVYRKRERVYLNTDDTDAVIKALIKEDYNMSHIQIEQGRLEEAFEQLVAGREVL